MVIDTPRWALPLLAPARYKGASGGRASGKSNQMADMMIEHCVLHPGTRAVCVREYQSSLRQSAKHLLETKIQGFELTNEFGIQESVIRTPGDGLIMFAGLQTHNADTIKSLEGADIVWVEEAHTLSKRSLDTLRPTVRKLGSEIWCSWNPRFEDDAVETIFRGASPYPDSVHVHVNFMDNPWLTDVVRDEAAWCLENDPAMYGHIWLGEYMTNSEATVFRNWKIQEFELPEGTSYRLGVDWGFAVDPTVMVRCAMDGRTLYIDHEAYAHQCEIIDTPELFDSIPDSRRWPSVADGSRPETISYMTKHGYPRMTAAKKGKDSVMDGTEWLRSLRIIVHPRCTHTINELRRYHYKIDPRTEAVLPILADEYNHCIDALRYACEAWRVPPPIKVSRKAIMKAAHNDHIHRRR